MTAQTIDQLATALVPCPRCEAPPREGCKTINGKRAGRSHSSRTEPIIAGWRKGYDEGITDAVVTVEQAQRREWTSEQLLKQLRRYL